MVLGRLMWDFMKTCLLSCEFTHPLRWNWACSINRMGVGSLSPFYTPWSFQFTKFLFVYYLPSVSYRDIQGSCGFLHCDWWLTVDAWKGTCMQAVSCDNQLAGNDQL
jgi:hypothetical protein